MFIVGGNEATPHKYPWMASLFFTQGSSGTYFCGGTLVIRHSNIDQIYTKERKCLI